MVKEGGRTLNAPVSEAKIVRTGAERRTHFSDPPEMGTNGLLILLSVVGENRAADPNIGEKKALRSRSVETALSTLDSVYRKLRQTP